MPSSLKRSARAKPQPPADTSPRMQVDVLLRHGPWGRAASAPIGTADPASALSPTTRHGRGRAPGARRSRGRSPAPPRSGAQRPSSSTTKTPWHRARTRLRSTATPARASSPRMCRPNTRVQPRRPRRRLQRLVRAPWSATRSPSTTRNLVRPTLWRRRSAGRMRCRKSRAGRSDGRAARA